MTVMLAILIVLALVTLVLLAVALRRSASNPVEQVVRDEFRQNRDDYAKAARELREELALGMKSGTDSLVKTVGELGTLQKAQLEGFAIQLTDLANSTQVRLDGIRSTLESQLNDLRNANDGKLTQIQSTLDSSLRLVGEDAQKASQALREEISTRLTTFETVTDKRYEALRQTIAEKLDANQQQAVTTSRDLRAEVSSSLKATSDSLIKSIGEMGANQKANLDSMGQGLKELTDKTETRLEAVKATVDARLQGIQDSNAAKLDEIRKTVDEQLQSTLDKRLTESFKVVSGHLESVQRGLGEMQALATGVGDLKRVLTNVKARGTWGEVQLGSILEEILTPDQYAKNVQTRSDSGERVEFAVKLPGPKGDSEAVVWLPIDSKFPQEAYLRLTDAAEAADAEGVQAAVIELARTIRGQAQAIQAKYLCPPATTDFGILFLPTEGLYAEVLRIPDLASELQRTFRVMVAGPTTLAALLSSLRIGFQTLAIERRASEVWKTLGAVKTEFHKFDAVLKKVRTHLDHATKTIDETGVRTRAMERQLREVAELPQAVAAELLKLPEHAAAANGNDQLEVAETEPATV